MNPFKYGTIVSGEDFCGRKTLLQQLIGAIESSQRIVLLGERRVGKSSAVYEAVLRCNGGRLLHDETLEKVPKKMSITSPIPKFPFL